jgi:hypothetical protein
MLKARQLALSTLSIIGVIFTYIFSIPFITQQDKAFASPNLHLYGILYASNDDRNPKQDTKLTSGDIKKLIKAGYDPEEMKGGKGTGKWDLFKDNKGNVYQKTKDNRGFGEDMHVNLNKI